MWDESLRCYRVPQAPGYTAAMTNWDPHFTRRSPMFAPLRGVARDIECAPWPTPADFNRLAAIHGVRSGGGAPLHFEAARASSVPTAADYERQIHDAGTVPLRAANWHDLFNALVWLVFPRTKAALNRAHAAQQRHAPAAAGGRGRRRDALTLLDESGVLVLSSSAEVLGRLRAFEWKRVFWEERETLLRTTQVLLFGHGLYEKALAPYVGMSAHALLLEVPAAAGTPDADTLIAAADVIAASAVEASLLTPRELTPLPLLGVPGWWDDNRHAAFYDNSAYFRPGRARGTTAR